MGGWENIKKKKKKDSTSRKKQYNGKNILDKDDRPQHDLWLLFTQDDYDGLWEK